MASTRVTDALVAVGVPRGGHGLPAVIFVFWCQPTGIVVLVIAIVLLAVLGMIEPGLPVPAVVEPVAALLQPVLEHGDGCLGSGVRRDAARPFESVEPRVLGDVPAVHEHRGWDPGWLIVTLGG